MSDLICGWQGYSEYQEKVRTGLREVRIGKGTTHAVRPEDPTTAVCGIAISYTDETMPWPATLDQCRICLTGRPREVRVESIEVRADRTDEHHDEIEKHVGPLAPGESRSVLATLMPAHHPEAVIEVLGQVIPAHDTVTVNLGDDLVGWLDADDTRKHAGLIARLCGGPFPVGAAMRGQQVVSVPAVVSRPGTGSDLVVDLRITEA